jgi:hypothetical protein
VHISTEECEEEFGSYQHDGSELVATFITWLQRIPDIGRNHTLETMFLGIPVHWWVSH